jgi:hypothetical protein
MAQQGDVLHRMHSSPCNCITTLQASPHCILVITHHTAVLELQPTQPLHAHASTAIFFTCMLSYMPPNQLRRIAARGATDACQPHVPHHNCCPSLSSHCAAWGAKRHPKKLADLTAWSSSR